MRASSLFLAIFSMVFISPLRGDVTFDDLFHITPAEVERSLGAQHLKALQAAVEDFNAVLNFKKPVYARFDEEAPLPADGGTSYYKGSGYSITISKSLFSMGDIHGYMYGPMLELAPLLGNGNSNVISRVSFYPSATLTALLK